MKSKKNPQKPLYPFRLSPCNTGEFPGSAEIPHVSHPAENSQVLPPEATSDWATLSPSSPAVPPNLGQLLSDLGTPPFLPHSSVSGSSTCAALRGTAPNQALLLKAAGDLFKDTHLCCPIRTQRGAPGLSFRKNH